MPDEPAGSGGPGQPAGSGGPGQPAEKPEWRAPGGFPWPPLVLIGVVVLVSAVVVGYRVTRPAEAGPRVVTDVAFVEQANRVCQAALPGLRPQDTSRTASITPEQIADQAGRAADGLAALAQELRGLPIAAEQEPYIEGWLDGWGTFIDAGRRYAQAVRTGNVDVANKVARSGDPAQRRADAFARGNGIKSCLLQSAIRKPRGPSAGF